MFWRLGQGLISPLWGAVTESTTRGLDMAEM